MDIFKYSSKKNPHIVCLGGGTGLFSLLSGLKTEISNFASLKAIVTTLDNGGSSGVLRTQYGVLPPGDIRNCIVAMSNQTKTMNELFQYRFDDRLNNHNLGNLLLTALSEISGSFEDAVKEASNILQINGEVIPVSLNPNTLMAKTSSGEILRGETIIDTTKNKKISQLYLKNPRAKANKRAIHALQQADIIIFGPGDLYTSILPNILFKEISGAIQKNKTAKKIFITPIMTKPGETDDFLVSDFKKEIETYVKSPLTELVINTSIPPVEALQQYYKEGKFPVLIDTKNLSKVKVLKGNLIDDMVLARHSPQKLAKAILHIAKK